MFNKDVTHPKMRRRIENPRVLLLDCNLEYKKGESQTNIEMLQEEDFAKILEQEEAYIKKICDDIIAHKPDLVITEKGVSDLAQHFLVKAGITAVRRLRKSDNLGWVHQSSLPDLKSGSGRILSNLTKFATQLNS